MFMHGILLTRLLHLHDRVQCTESSQVPCNFLELVEVTSESECVCHLHISSHCPSAMAGFVANSLLFAIPYSGNGLSLCVVPTQFITIFSISLFMRLKNNCDKLSFKLCFYLIINHLNHQSFAKFAPFS